VPHGDFQGFWPLKESASGPKRAVVIILRQAETAQKPIILGGKNVETELIDARAVAKILDCSPKTIERLEQRGQLPKAMRIGRLRKWSRRAILQWIERSQKPETVC
jgi:predicted DNA-binding transcriptional regulator AlpA